MTPSVNPYELLRTLSAPRCRQLHSRAGCAPVRSRAAAAVMRVDELGRLTSISAFVASTDFSEYSADCRRPARR